MVFALEGFHCKCYLSGVVAHCITEKIAVLSNFFKESAVLRQGCQAITIFAQEGIANLTVFTDNNKVLASTLCYNNKVRSELEI